LWMSNDQEVVQFGGRASRPPLPGILPGSTAPDETSGASGRDARPPSSSGKSSTPPRR
jgi:hypothetical protein